METQTLKKRAPTRRHSESSELTEVEKRYQQGKRQPCSQRGLIGQGAGPCLLPRSTGSQVTFHGANARHGQVIAAPGRGLSLGTEAQIVVSLITLSKNDLSQEETLDERMLWDFLVALTKDSHQPSGGRWTLALTLLRRKLWAVANPCVDSIF